MWPPQSTVWEHHWCRESRGPWTLGPPNTPTPRQVTPAALLDRRVERYVACRGVKESRSLRILRRGPIGRGGLQGARPELLGSWEDQPPS
eukprot:3357477-Pyramimonas_sp.AAC.2